MPWSPVGLQLVGGPSNHRCGCVRGPGCHTSEKAYVGFHKKNEAQRNNAYCTVMKLNFLWLRIWILSITPLLMRIHVLASLKPLEYNDPSGNAIHDLSTRQTSDLHFLTAVWAAKARKHRDEDVLLSMGGLGASGDALDIQSQPECLSASSKVERLGCLWALQEPLWLWS